MENVNPRVFEKAANRHVLEREEDDAIHDEIDAREIFGKFKELCVEARGMLVTGVATDFHTRVHWIEPCRQFLSIWQ